MKHQTWDEQKLENIRARQETWLMRQPGVQGVGVGMDENGQLCLRILTDRLKPDVKRAIKSRIGSVPVLFDETGPIEAYSG